MSPRFSSLRITGVRVRPRSLERLLRAVAADLLGHRETFFRPLRGIAQGETIRVRSRRQVFLHTDSIRIESPELPWAVQGTSAPTLTLLTCFPFDYEGPAPRRFVMQARMTAAEMERSVHRSSAEIRAQEGMQ